MPKTTEITISLSQELAARLDEAVLQQSKSRREFLTEAVVRYIDECQWRQLLHYGEERARERGIGPKDVAGLVEEYRVEKHQPPV